ncbi:Mkt1p KNAG_0E01630 [Huiozyma naganishii CBS 8797]|uniref:XPG N-terminal domain-containing protein n=1 Tax=Huiozyma naganishii (strain ATCC MYA-139 / BCRC 22969 / CBS 8797 / KCTC 17520 / NBRC 10181 / NCYC 3082 / Yp74L-3) TaxID=1071383 RepID=J7R6E5_HUIN7|nr:hypothetical protein KNAG_0E01630 [Kazachstania naganishii CBS 8797]CCK70425.1 hypothetical protein KNAG_0E01630 [Kazachstania naganishii CBS 8797]
MPIQSLELFLFERGLVGSYPIDSLKNTTLGIDVNHYVSRLLTTKKEQFLDAIGGFPISLKMYLESDLKIFKESNITPVFVFNGSGTANQLAANSHFTALAKEVAAASSITPSGSQASRSAKELMLAQRHKAWTQWSNLLNNNQSTYIDQPLQPQEPFRYQAIIELKKFQSDLIDYFIEHQIVYQVAPYCSWIQLSYLLSSGFIDAIYGPTDCLMLSNVDRFILGMEFPNKDFRFIDRARVLKDFHVSSEEFIDICMAVGNDLQPSVLPPLQIYPSNKLFEISLEMVLNTGTNFYAYQLSSNAQGGAVQEVDKYEKGVSSLKYMPVLFSSGRVDVYTIDPSREHMEESRKPSANSEHRQSNENMASVKDRSDSQEGSTNLAAADDKTFPIPRDVHDIIGQRLPDEYYYYKSLGLISGKLFDAITTGVYPEEPPLDGGSSNSYRELIAKSVELFKNKEINLLTQNINRYFQMKPIVQVKWFSPENKVALTNRTSPSVFEQLNHIIIKTNNAKTTPFSVSEFVKLLLSTEDLSKEFISDQVVFPNSVPVDQKINSAFDLLSTNFLRLLIQLEFFDFDFGEKSLTPNQWGRAFLKLGNLGAESDFVGKLFILLVFLKTKVLSISQDFTPSVRSSLSDHTLRSYPQESKYILALTRLLTLFQVDQKPTAIYHGPIDKKTLTFREHLDFVNDNLNDLFESLVVSSLTANEFDKLSLQNHEWQSEIVYHMPFKRSLPNTVMSMMVEFFLQKYLHNGNIKHDALALVSTEFSTYKCVPNLTEQFDQSIAYLSQCKVLFDELCDMKLVSKDESELLSEAVTFATNAVRGE